MNTDVPPKLVAVVGGSGAGKSWLVHRLRNEFAKDSTLLSLDDFYRDLSHLEPVRREKINFDQPDAIDWPLFETALRDLHNGVTVTVPRYDFVTHTRLPLAEIRKPRSFVFVEGLWLLWPKHIRELFDLRIFLECAQSLRWQRRLARDLTERGRTIDSVRGQFWDVVVPMHARFVEPQKAWCDLAIEQPTSARALEKLIETVRALRRESCWEAAEVTSSAATRSEITAT